MLKVIYELPCSIFASDAMLTIVGKYKEDPRQYVYIERPFNSELCEVYHDIPEKICRRLGSKILWAVWEE